MTAPRETPPAWPFGTPTEAEAAVWAELHTRPTSSLWRRFGLTRDAATYTRTLLAFEDGGYANAALGGLVARQADNLGLTVAGAARNRWTWPAQTPPGGTRAHLVPIQGVGAHRTSRDRFLRTSPNSPETHRA